MNKRTALFAALESRWIENEFDQELVEEVIHQMHEIQEKHEVPDSEWIVIPNLTFLACVKDLTHPSYNEIFEDEDRVANLYDDIQQGVSFCFYEQEGYLKWER